MTRHRAPYATDRATDRRSDADDDLAAWRWRNYTEHLTDLGYDLDGGGPSDDGPDDARSGHRQRGRPLTR